MPLSIECLCDNYPNGYAHAPGCPAKTKIPYCEDCGHQRRCVCGPPVIHEPDPNRPDPWADEDPF
ncbi:hypothetical protein SEA_SOOS_30 [Gordonia phage Soos]|nr:hypothetical protein SEA_SOOS_30 [Gordonia phage Soos]